MSNPGQCDVINMTFGVDMAFLHSAINTFRNNNFLQGGNIHAMSLARPYSNLGRFLSVGRRIRDFPAGAMLPPAIRPCARLRASGPKEWCGLGRVLGLALDVA
jgi:hypothetical protein